MVLGTVPYMSPEQVQAQAVDHRSDIFSLGILLYEMACGKRPFQGDNAASVISAVLKDQPPLVSAIKADVPNHLGRIVRRCLEKDPDLRYQSAKNLHHELETLHDEARLARGTARQAPPSERSPSAAEPPSREVPPRPDSVTFTIGKKRLWPVAAVAAVAAVALGWWFVAGGGSGTDEATDRASAERSASLQSGRPRLVVIPFENLGSTDDDYFAAGMTEELLNFHPHVHVLVTDGGF
ncbi:MAG: protein kinase, partial [Thermoanaerobaculia bacterium]